MRSKVARKQVCRHGVDADHAVSSKIANVLNMDILCVICSTLSLAKLVSVKCISKTWASACRRTILSPSWQSLETNRIALSSVPPRFFVYKRAEDAFACLCAGRKVQKLLLRRKCKQMAAINGVRLCDERGDGVADALFKNEKVTHGIFDKTIRVLQRKDSDKIFVVSDVYHYPSSADKLNKFAEKCTAGGIDVFAFELVYPRESSISKAFHPPKTVAMLNSGYSWFARGKIAGFMV